jgi:hypothetical protein
MWLHIPSVQNNRSSSMFILSFSKLGKDHKIGFIYILAVLGEDKLALQQFLSWNDWTNLTETSIR